MTICHIKSKGIVFASQHNAMFVENVSVSAGKSNHHYLQKKNLALPWTRKSIGRNKLTPSVDLVLHKYAKSMISENI